ncbi:MAG: ribonuclease III [Solirubrobacterales bacterium]
MPSTGMWRPPEVAGRVAGLQRLLGDLPDELVRQAFTHASWTDNREASYERLAFLGDSVLGLAVSSAIYPQFARSSAGRLTKIRAQTVSGRACAEVALELGVPERLRAQAPATEGGGRAVEQLLATERALASVTEAVIGACYLHHGYEAVAPAVVEAFAEHVVFASEHHQDFKSALQERLARNRATVEYVVVDEQGPPHDRQFRVQARTDGQVIGTGDGRSKKLAEQAAAEQALHGLPQT